MIFINNTQIELNEDNWIQVRTCLWSKNSPLNYRKIRFVEWCGDSQEHRFNSWPDLANKLHSSFTTYRTRPKWSPELLKCIKVYYGEHRRHIIMSSLMRQAVYAVSDSGIEYSMKLDTYNCLLQEFNGYPGSDLPTAETNLVSLLHNNQNNIIVDDGSYNTAIGMLATSINNYILKNPFDNVLNASNVESFKGTLRELQGGFEVYTQKEIIEIFISILPAYYGSTYIEILEELYDNMAFDIMTTVSNPKKIDHFISLHPNFVRCAETGDLGLLVETVHNFLTPPQ